MRKNKKLLLGGLSVLTLVAAGSGAVSTFAWYQAQSSAKLTNVDAGTQSMSTATTQYNLGEQSFSNILDISVSKTNNTLELAHYNDSSATKKLTTGYLDKSGTFRDLGLKGGNGGDADQAKLVSESNALYDTLTVTVKIKSNLGATVEDDNHNVYTTAVALAMLRSRYVKCQVVPAEGGRGRAFITDASDTAVTAEQTTTYDNIVTQTHTGQQLTSLINSDGTINTSANATGLVFTTYLYVYGGAGNYSDMTGEAGAAATVSSGNFQINILDAANA